MTSRREFLRRTGLATAAFATPAWAQTTGRTTASLSISESFVFSEWERALEQAITRSGGAADTAFWRAFRAREAEVAPAVHRGHALLTLPAPGVELFALDQARSLASLANSALAQKVSGSRSRYGGLGMIVAGDHLAVREAERAIGRLKLSGLSLGANRAMSASDRSLWPVYEYAEAARTPVYFAAAYSPAAGDAPYRALGTSGVITGAAADSARHVRQLIFGGVLDRFPDLQVVLARLGEGAPYWFNELEQTEIALRETSAPALRRTVADYFRSNIFLTTSDMQTSEPARFWAAVIGKDRILRSASRSAWS